MSKIDEYRRAKAWAEALRNFVKSANHSQCDKFGATVKISESYKGMYGSSSCSGWGQHIEEAIAVEMRDALKEFAERAAKRAEGAAEKARRSAAEEAREVLAEVVPT